MKTILFCCSILLFAAGCSKTNNSANTNATDIFPDKVGDTWVYLVNDTTVSAFNGQSTVVQYNMNVSIIDSVQLPESIYGIQLPQGTEAKVWVYNSPGVTDTNYVFQKGDSLIFYEIHQTSKSYATQYIIPLNLNGSWQYTVGGLGMVTVDSQANIIVGQNNFDNAFHIYGFAGMPDEGFSIEEWIKNNVGLVKRYIVTNNTSGFKNFTKWSLVSYNLK